jgi:hypothetical protein
MAQPTSPIPLLFSFAALVACGERMPPAGAAVAPAPLLRAQPEPPLPLATESPYPADLAPCSPETGVISNGEIGPNRTNPVEGRGGYWYTYSDKEGSVVSPLSGDQGGTFGMAEGGANGTAHAARMSGTLGTAQIVYAGMGLSFLDPKGEYNARKYRGISFWAKKGSPDSTKNVRLKLPDRNTDPEGHVCSECFNDFGEYLELTDEWKKFTVAFATMKQQSDWGKPRPRAIATDALYGIQFQVDDYAKKFDIWVDEIEFTGCSR